MQRREEHHLLLRAVDDPVQDLPLGLLVDQVDPDRVRLGVQVVEGVELEAEQQRVEVTDPLLHQGQGRVQPPRKAREG